MALSGSIILLFVLATVVALLAKRLRVPYTVALVVAGLVLGSVGGLRPPVLTKELLFALFLPGLLFEAAFHLDAEEFWRNRLTIFSLALPGVVAATILTAGALVAALRLAGAESHLGWGPAFVFATLIAATDPIAVVAVVRTLGAPARLGVLIEGESLLNDGTAAASFGIAVTYVLGAQPQTVSLVVDFLYLIVGGVIIGGVIGLLTWKLAAWVDDPMLMITLTTTAAYGSFLIGEGLQTSGVIATVTAGLLSGNRASLEGMAPSIRASVQVFWEYVAFALNSLVFLLVGFQARVPSLIAEWRPIVIAYLVVTLSRTVVTYGLNAVHPKDERLSREWTAVLTWSGLRGSLAMVLALSLPLTMPQRDLVVTITVGVVVLSILVQGLTVRPLLRWLRIAGPPAAKV
jgi:monovalent cation:H+ antiporter, CPA1 family